MTDQPIDLKAENEALKLDNATKSELISVSAHGLRTSLTSMKWILKMFIDGDFGALTAEQMSFMNKAYESDDRMIRLVNKMLSINHAEDSLESMHLAPTDLVKLLDEIVFDFTGESYKKGIELIFLKPDHALAPATVDPEKMRVVIQNLIENAIKYSNKGGRVFVNIGEKAGATEISVRDTGIGILKMVRENPTTAKIPLIVFSNLSEDKDIKRAKELGATDYMVKSNFTLDELADKIKELLK